MDKKKFRLINLRNQIFFQLKNFTYHNIKLLTIVGSLANFKAYVIVSEIDFY